MQVKGLFRNCRKRPYKAATAPLIGSYGVFRGYASAGNNVVGAFCGIMHLSTDITEIAAKTPVAKTTYNSVLQSCWDAATDLGSSGFATDTYNNAILGGVMRASGVHYHDSVYTDYGLLRSLGTINAGASASWRGLAVRDTADPSDFNLTGITVRDDFGASYTYSITFAGAGIASGSTLGRSSSPISPYTSIVSAQPLSGLDTAELVVTITNTSGFNRPNVRVYVYGSNFADLSASYPASFWSGVYVATFDAPGITSGLLSRVLTAETAGAGTTYVTCVNGASASYATSYRTAASVGLHYADLDELCCTWTA